ncbi:hypothetical protein COB55_01640 [Candidatus Wolfebacteria bacterium]|nr:MAG: hypothetical protein COB55_01640 [Candidatus Wolfebacteria bacterium]
MHNLSIKTGGVKFILGWILVLLIRLLPFRPPNFEPMLATIMPYSKKYGMLPTFLFGFIGIVLFDIITGRVGMWTLITGVSYGALGIGAYLFFKKRKSSVTNYLTFGIVGTILYDAVTGLSIGPLFYNQPFMSALAGQIPFTLMHLLGTVIFSLAISPAVYKWVVSNNTLEIPFLWKKIYPSVK